MSTDSRAPDKGCEMNDPVACSCCAGSKNAGRPSWIPMIVAGAFALAAEALAWITGDEHSPWVIVCAVAALAVSGREVLPMAWAAVRSLTLDIGFLMTIAIGGAVSLGSWPEAAMVCFLFAVAERVEALSGDRARNAIQALMQKSPDMATVQDANGAWQTVHAGEVTVGRIGLVKPGERIPFDGELISGATSVDQSAITGESVPVDKAVGDPVFAGTVNGEGAFEYRVTADEGHSTLARIIHAVESAQAQKAPTQRMVDVFARYYTPGVVVAAALVAGIPPLFFAGDFAEWFYRALVLLVISCPCALVLSTPVTVVSGLARAARRGILIKGGAHLEGGRRIKVLALDKTGTLTHGKPRVTDVAPLNGVAPDQILRVAAGLSSLSNHPISKAVTEAWRGDPAPVDGFQALAGRGVTGCIEGRRYFLGNHRLAEENAVCGDHVESVLLPFEAEGKTAVILSTEHESLGVIAMADAVRKTGPEAVAELHRLGVVSVMLTGDNQATAQAVAEAAAIDDVRAELLPEDKLEAVSALRHKHGPVGMVGDGINDAPALARADLGFAMGAAGSDVALETADVALMDDDLRKLPEFIRLSRRTASILKQNFAIAIGIKVVFFTLAMMGHATLWSAVFADMGGSLIVVANGLRMLRSSSRG